MDGVVALEGAHGRRLVAELATSFGGVVAHRLQHHAKRVSSIGGFENPFVLGQTPPSTLDDRSPRLQSAAHPRADGELATRVGRIKST